MTASVALAIILSALAGRSTAGLGPLRDSDRARPYAGSTPVRPAPCPAFTPGDTQPVYLPPGCTLAAPGYWRDADAENAVDAAVVALRRCAANEVRAARLLREVPEPPSRVSWALMGAAAGAAIILLAGVVE